MLEITTNLFGDTSIDPYHFDYSILLPPGMSLRNKSLIDQIKQVIVNEKKRAITVILNNGDVGVAKCMSGDDFNIELGIYKATLTAMCGSKNKAHKKMAELIKNAKVLK